MHKGSDTSDGGNIYSPDLADKKKNYPIRICTIPGIPAQSRSARPEYGKYLLSCGR